VSSSDEVAAFFSASAAHADKEATPMVPVRYLKCGIPTYAGRVVSRFEELPTHSLPHSRDGSGIP
jgi:hypothetical protein